MAQGPGGHQYVAGGHGVAATPEFRRLPAGDRGDAPVRASFSAGVATYPDDGTTVEELLQAADRRLYHAKASGRARVVARD